MIENIDDFYDVIVEKIYQYKKENMGNNPTKILVEYDLFQMIVAKCRPPVLEYNPNLPISHRFIGIDIDSVIDKPKGFIEIIGGSEIK